MIARQGVRFVVLGALVDLIGIGGAVSGVMSNKPVVSAVGGALACGGAVFTAFCVYFFRDPERALPADSAKLYSPGDGVVLSVAMEPGSSGQTIRIFLSIFDVHIQRVPCSGRVTAKKYEKGSFIAAMRDEAKGNERSILTIEPEGRAGQAVVVEQIAGLVARRIETWPEPGAKLRAGERYGIIYFGSQAAVRLPPGAKAVVKPGDRVAGGVTPIAEWA